MVVAQQGSLSEPSPAVRGALRELRARTAAIVGPRLLAMRLFGSHARGDFGPESDVDVLIVVEGLNEAERRQVFDVAWMISADRLLVLAPLALSAEEWQTLVRRGYRIAVEIGRDGVDA